MDVDRQMLVHKIERCEALVLQERSRADAYLSELKALREKPNENAKNVTECWIHLEEMCVIESREEWEKRHPGQALSMAVFVALSKRDTKAEAERDTLAERVKEMEEANAKMDATPSRALLIARVATLEKALLDVQSQAAGHADEFSRNVWRIAADALDSK